MTAKKYLLRHDFVRDYFNRGFNFSKSCIMKKIRKKRLAEKNDEYSKEIVMI